MRLLKILSKVAAALVAVCGLVMTSCEQQEKAGDALTVSLQSVSVGPEKGSQFVSVKCTGSWTLRIVAEDSELTWASLNMASGVGNKNGVILSYDANTTDAERSVDVVIDNGTRRAFSTLTQSARSVGPTPNPNPNPEPEPTPGVHPLSKTGWLELPALDDPDLEYYSHSFKMNGLSYRNYSFGWSQKDYTTVWVAYPLWSAYTDKKVDRTNKWAYDPLLGPTLSPAPFDGYAGNYDRGHLLPSADRLCCYDANVQTFYSTNIVPQDATHNQGLWENLEGKIRSLANSADSTYIVTGVMIKNPIGYTTDSTKDEYGNRRNSSELKTLPVASHFFKAVLRYSKASTLGQWSAAGFYYKHESNAEQQLVSIDKLEELTGINFFVNLESKIGAEQAARLEAMTPNTSVWQ